MKLHILLFLVVLLFFFCVLLGFQRQQKLPPEKHEAEVVLVIVDVIVTKDGEFVQIWSKKSSNFTKTEGKFLSIPLNL